LRQIDGVSRDKLGSELKASAPSGFHVDMNARNEIVRGYLRRLRERSEWEAGHAERVAVYAVATAVELKVSGAALLAIRYAATLHAVGKLNWPSEWFSNPELVTTEAERGFPVAGAKLLAGTRFLRSAARIVADHGQRGGDAHELSLGAKIVGTCETFDRLAFGHEGQDPWEILVPPDFDPAVVDALRRVAIVIQPIGS